MNLTELGLSDRLAQDFAPLAEAGWELGRVALEHRAAYRLYTRHGELMAEVTGQFRHQALELTDFPAVGDWVAYQSLDDHSHGLIHRVLPRRSQFVRKVAGAQTQGQIVAANVDTVFLMMGLDHDFNLRRLERYLVLAGGSQAQPVIVLNKADSCPDLTGKQVAVAAIAQTQLQSLQTPVPIHPISALTGQGLTDLQPYLVPGQTVALIGSSGVGKSTLTNFLLGAPVQITQSVRAQDQRGRHTTTHRHLLPLPTGAWLIDTPGMRELQIWSSDDDLEHAFADLETLAHRCRFRDCQHQSEPGCAVQAAIASGDLDPKRLQSYQKLQREQHYLASRQDPQAHHNSKRRWKQINKAMKQRRQEEES